MRQINRDPFARETTYRKSLVVGLCGPLCAWCGNGGKPLVPNSKNGTDDPRRLYRYGTVRDGMNACIYWDERVFCSIDCYRTFYGRA